ncbi:HD domain-containing phosphohydrolase [Paludibacterium purpuratum]|uniref:Putative two-component system response regulator n=1 Tax=Paludibacterium purpuratum TaxID=1144873 RepID=A0A4V3DUN0_9NEIS|nr:HD domain-containing phosphohydrolase [Paludibacterium purpuratum]TDR73890.1 putative two-component system response regulator [Paludibacterium purpuratum]
MSTGPILLVDDEPSNLAALHQVLSPTYRLVYARTAAEALAQAIQHQPLLILLDIRLPDMDGYTVCRQLKANPSTEAIPVIFVTALADIGDEAAGFDAGAVDYIIKPIMPAIVQARVRTHLSLVRATTLERSYRDAISMLGEAGHYNDTDTGDHIWRMAAYARALAEACGWDAAACGLIELASPMHDMGKIGIPNAILRKPGPLTPEEWEVMKTHAQMGHDILIRSPAPVFQMAAEIALCHHERWDGGGYPGGLVGEAIPTSARIVALADVFDALSMKRPYKAAWPLEQTMQMIQQGDPGHFDPNMVATFVSILPKILEIKAMWQS